MSTESDYLERATSVEPPAEPTVFELLADRRRQTVLRYLNDRGSSASLTELADAVALEERQTDTETMSGHVPVSSADRRQVRISLHHVHVPMLAEANAVDVDPETNEVTLCERGRLLLDRLEAVHGSIE